MMTPAGRGAWDTSPLPLPHCSQAQCPAPSSARQSATSPCASCSTSQPALSPLKYSCSLATVPRGCCCAELCTLRRSTFFLFPFQGWPCDCSCQPELRPHGVSDCRSFVLGETNLQRRSRVSDILTELVGGSVLFPMSAEPTERHETKRSHCKSPSYLSFAGPVTLATSPRWHKAKLGACPS